MPTLRCHVGRLRAILAWEAPGAWGDGVLGWRVVPLHATHVRLVNVRLGALHLAVSLLREGPTYRWLAYQAHGDAGEGAADGR